ncbi:dickkopf-related protein 3 isoform X3 [Tiliqua scincoides]|uniref:dickkopf-related protein 3 isoform X3 n=1 Tax=Tiliqua scincoides TaxID=71010 RepID=UPI00346344B9
MSPLPGPSSSSIQLLRAPGACLGFRASSQWQGKLRSGRLGRKRAGVRRQRQRQQQSISLRQGCCEADLRMSLLGSRLLFLSVLLGLVYAAPTSDGDEEQPKETVLSFPRDEASLNEMFREVEELMEDTQYKLRNAVKEAVDNQTGSTSYSETVITSVQEGEVKRNNECIIDEDCETGKYCEFSGLEYKCHVCKTQHTHCSRDVECCGHQLCVWGECRKAASRGENGTICENQHDCNPGMCCAFSKDLLFPVCTPLPGEGEPCHDPSNRFLNLITWELEPDGALDRCPCTHGLICQTLSHSSDSLCELSSNRTQNGDNGKQVVADETFLLDLVAEDILGDYEDRLIKKALDGLADEGTDSEDLDLGSDLLFGDEM